MEKIISRLKIGTSVVMIIASCNSALAVITFGSGDPSNNTSPPLVARGIWYTTLLFGNYTGVPIGPRHFMGAAHTEEGFDSAHFVVRDNTGQAKSRPTLGEKFKHNNVCYTIVNEYINPNGQDLIIYEVDQDFHNWVGINNDTNETGMKFIDFGRGLQRGDELWGAGLMNCRVTNVIDLREITRTNKSVSLGQLKNALQEFPSNSHLKGNTLTYFQDELIITNVLKGWSFGQMDGILRWGRNEVEGVLTLGPHEFLTATFDDNGDPDECFLAFGDSGGPCFSIIDGKWKLIGFNYGIDGCPALSRDGEGFYGAVFDISGLWSENYQYPLDVRRPLHFYLSRVSTQIGWINSVIQKK